MLVSLPACAGKLTRNLVNLLAYAGWLWICKFFLPMRVGIDAIFSECMLHCNISLELFFKTYLAQKLKHFSMDV